VPWGKEEDWGCGGKTVRGLLVVLLGNCYKAWLLLVITSYGGGFAALWRYPDRSSQAQLPGIPYPWLSSAWRVPKVGHTSTYDIKSWQPFHCARTCKDNLVTFMT